MQKVAFVVGLERDEGWVGETGVERPEDGSEKGKVTPCRAH